MTRWVLAFVAVMALAVEGASAEVRALAADFRNPPRQVGVRCWWWWLNSNVTKAAITRDLEAMHDKGFSGAMIFDAGTELRWGPDDNVPNGPMFSSPEWAELFLHALRESDRLDLELGLSIQSGWNLGGPFVTLDDKAKQITWSEIAVEGPAVLSHPLPVPKANYDYYRDICLLAYPRKDWDPSANRKPISHLAAKSGARELGGSAPDCRFLLNDDPSVPGEEDALLQDIVDISGNLSEAGALQWNVPPGKWTILRIGYTPTEAHVATSSDNWKGHVLDYLSKEVFDRYWYRTVDPLLKQAGPLAGTVLKQLETDSWECGGMNWSPGFDEEFKRYCGYDIIKYLPVVTGKIVEDRDTSNAFLADLRKTIAHAVSENHYRTFAEHAAQYNLGIQPECSGPHAAPIDGIKNYAHSDIVMSEFWIPSPHRPNPENRFFVKQASSAAHIYGKQFVGAESFTSLRKPHWGDVLWRDLKPAMDFEYCEGLNIIFFHTFTCSPVEMGIPGQEYFAGTHVNPQVTWWDYSDAFMDYMNRIQAVVQRGTFVADVLYYYGDHVPNIAVYKGFNRAGALPGYDFDVTNEEVLLQLKVQDGTIVVPGGIRYRVLVLPDHQVLSLAVLKKVEQLLEQGATVLGPKPERLVSLVGGVSAQRTFHRLANQLWGDAPASSGRRQVGKGRLVWGQGSREYLLGDGVAPDFEVVGVERQLDYQYIHYTVDNADIYFVCNQTDQPQSVECALRVSGKQPELWDPVTGQIISAVKFRQEDGRTIVPMEFDPRGSWLVVLGKPTPDTRQGTGRSNHPVMEVIQQVQGPWQVEFDPVWGGPASIEFATLTDWTQHTKEGIKYYSGQATYRNSFELAPVEGNPYWLQLSEVEDVGIAAAKLNGKDLGVTWTKPFRLEITNALQAGHNELEITVVNSWQNRLIGDRSRPQQDRFTRTNIRIREDWSLRPSGLLGPVVIQSTEAPLGIDSDTVKRWSEPYRGWHYYPDHVIPAEPNIKGFEAVRMTDVPTVYQRPGEAKWYMTFIGFDGSGYQSFVAESDDLVHWANTRLAMGYGPEGEFDHGGVVLGAFLYESYDIKAPRTLKKINGKYFSLYGAYPRQGGYELRPGYEGVACSDDGLTWRRAKDEPILSVHQKDCGQWEKDCIYQPWLVEYQGQYHNFYNAANGGVEQMGLALSGDLLEWKRYGGNPVIPHGPVGSYHERFSSDGKVFWDEDHWVNFFFGVGRGGAHVMAAFSPDLYHWTVDPDPLYKSGGNPSGLDQRYAHKISLVWNPVNKTAYMFYNAVGNQGRGIGLITSRPISGRERRL